MTGRLHPVLSGFFLVCLTGLPVIAHALDADPVLLGAPDKKPFVMTVMGVRKAFAVAPDRIRVEIGIAANTSPLNALNAYRIVSEDDSEYAYDRFVKPEAVSFPAGHLVTEAVVPDGFKAESSAANITSFSRETVDLKLPVPMKSGKTYSVVIYLTQNPVEGWTTTILFLSFAFFGLFSVLTVIIKYLQIIVDLIFKRKTYNFESIEKLT